LPSLATDRAGLRGKLAGMKRLGSALLFVILAACGGSSPPPAAPEPKPAVAPAPAVPPAPAVATATCEATADEIMEVMGGAALDPAPVDRRDHWKRRFTEVVTSACREDGWPEWVIDCAGEAETEYELEVCADGLDDATQDKLRGRIRALITELTPPSAAPAPPPSSSSVPASDAAVMTAGLTSIAACDEYVAVFDAYLACDKVPPQVVEASKQGIDAMKHAWADLRDADVPREARQAASDACRQGTDALKESATALGCSLDATAKPPAKVPGKAPGKAKNGAKAKKGG
jgi:hypothetical protein